MPESREPIPDWLGDWRIYKSDLIRLAAVQRAVDAAEALHPEWRETPTLIDAFASALHDMGIDPGCPAYDAPMAALRTALAASA